MVVNLQWTLSALAMGTEESELLPLTKISVLMNAGTPSEREERLVSKLFLSSPPKCIVECGHRKGVDRLS